MNSKLQSYITQTHSAGGTYGLALPTGNVSHVQLVRFETNRKAWIIRYIDEVKSVSTEPRNMSFGHIAEKIITDNTVTKSKRIYPTLSTRKATQCNTNLLAVIPTISRDKLVHLDIPVLAEFDELLIEKTYGGKIKSITIQENKTNNIRNTWQWTQGGAFVSKQVQLQALCVYYKYGIMPKIRFMVMHSETYANGTIHLTGDYDLFEFEYQLWQLEQTRQWLHKTTVEMNHTIYKYLLETNN